MEQLSNRRKILNDPVYGFITVPGEILIGLVEHPWFQRLRRIQQLGLTHMVYPGALHTRFHHAIGAMHLMSVAIPVLRSKGTDISPLEEEAALAAILMHDIGHGPYSHVLENTLITDISHEELGQRIMDRLDDEAGGAFSLAKAVFSGEYGRPFLSQLVSSQLDVDRLDYLRRDSFFTGVSEGVIGTERIIKMLDVADGELVVEEKAIYSIEKFLVARRLMYWQVYLHKTVLSAEHLLIRILERAKHLASAGEDLYASPALRFFLRDYIDGDRDGMLDAFVRLDDYDVLAAIKVWVESDDRILAYLSRSLLDRRLFRIELSADEPGPSDLDRIRRHLRDLGFGEEETDWYTITGETSNRLYARDRGPILMKSKDGPVRDISTVSGHLNFLPLDTIETKYFVCYPKFQP